MTGVSEQQLAEFERILGYEFKDRPLLATALTHSSAKSVRGVSNERLEFLGDAILGLVITEHLFQKLPNQDEGRLTRIKSVVVSANTLADVSRELGVQRYLITGKGISSRRELPRSLLANAFEALVAAMYLDGGPPAARTFILERLAGRVDEVLRNQHARNYKSLLQQYIQKQHMITPTYRVLSEHGPDHGKSFEIAAQIKGREYEAGWGHSKKEAEQKAAEEALRELIGDHALTEHSDEEILRGMSR